jgi:hypothetical protein
MRPNPDERTGATPAPRAARPQPSPSPAVAWREIGRAEHGDALWITWIGFADDRGREAFYRSLVVADDAIAVSVEREAASGDGGTRAVHRGRCGPPPPDDATSIEERAARLLAAADEAVAKAGGGRARRVAGAQPDAG